MLIICSPLWLTSQMTEIIALWFIISSSWRGGHCLESHCWSACSLFACTLYGYSALSQFPIRFPLLWWSPGLLFIYSWLNQFHYICYRLQLGQKYRGWYQYRKCSNGVGDSKDNPRSSIFWDFQEISINGLYRMHEPQYKLQSTKNQKLDAITNAICT